MAEEVENTIPTQGTKLYVDNDGEFELLACMTDLSPFDGSASEVDVTTMCDDAQVQESGLLDLGNVTGSVFYVPSDKAQQQLEDDKVKGSKATRNYAIAWPDKAGTKHLFRAWVSEFSPSGSVNERWTADLKLRVYPRPMPQRSTDSMDDLDPEKFEDGEYDKFGGDDDEGGSDDGS